MTLGPTTFPGARKGVTLPLLVISGLATGPRQGWATGFDSSPRADNTSVRAGGVLSVGIPRFLNKSQHFTVHLFSSWRPGSARGSDGGPRRFTEVVPTPHAYSGQWPVKTKRARARSCASVVTRKRPSLNRALTRWQEEI